MNHKQHHFRGIVIRTLPSSEADLIVAILDESGEKHVAIAKQARKSRKRFGSALDLFDFGRFETSAGRGNLAMLQSFIPESGFRNLRSSLSKVACSSVIAEAVDLLVPEGHPEQGTVTAFTVIHLALDQINRAPEARTEFRALYQGLTQLLEISGYHDRETARTPSLHALRLTIKHLEQCVERRLKSKESLELVAKDLAA